MNFIYLSLSAPLVCFLAHVIACRMFPHPRSSQKQLILVCAMTVFVLSLSSLALGATPPQALYVFLTATLLIHAYFHVFNMSETARRIRILLHTTHPDRVPSLRMETDDLLERRIDRLESLGSIQRVENGYVARRGILLFAAQALHLWRQLYYPSKPSSLRPEESNHTP